MIAPRCKRPAPADVIPGGETRVAMKAREAVLALDLRT